MTGDDISDENRIYLDTNGDPLKIAGVRIAHGKPVGEGYLFGRMAVDLLRSGYATMADLRKYRSALYFNEKSGLGEEAAKRNEDARLERHAYAEKFTTKRTEK